MYGPPGTGKTMLAKAMCSEGGIYFMNVSPSVLASKWKGDSEKMVKFLFDIADFHAPSIIFIDEIDAMTSARKESDGESTRKFMNELLTRMEGAGSDKKHV
jgi:SpoVK/Ycf46/Vps4 family AAA+-type ATPase